MKKCWSEGELRAFLDRELPPEDLERAASHVAVCPACGRRLAEVQARAGRVAALLGELNAPGLPAAAMPARPRPRRRFAAALALAAGLALGALVWKRPVSPAPSPARAQAEKPAPLAVIQAPPAARPAGTRPPLPGKSAPPAAVQPPPAARAALRPPARRRNPPPADAFVRLDDEPFETGMVLRMALGPNEVPADVVFSSDGRPRAVRLVDFK